MSKIMYIDVETTGLDPKMHSIVQCSGIIEIDDVEKDRFDLRIRPLQGSHIDPAALKVIGKTSEDLMAYPNNADQFSEFLLLLKKHVNRYDRKDKMFFVAYNGTFDMQFIRAWFEARLDKYFGSWFYFPPLDIMTIAANEMMDVRSEMTDFKLGTVCEQLGIEWDELAAHDALYDVEKTMEVHSRLEEWNGTDESK